MTIKNNIQEMIEIFVVDIGLKITPIQILKSKWEAKGRYFAAQIGERAILGMKDGWNDITNYAGFETKEKAESFVTAAKIGLIE